MTSVSKSFSLLFPLFLFVSMKQLHFSVYLKIRFLHVPKTPGFLLLQGIKWHLAGQVAILIVIYNPKLGQAKTTYLICIPTATKEVLLRDCKRSSRESKRNSIASVHIKTEQVSGMTGKSFQNYQLFLKGAQFNISECI